MSAIVIRQLSKRYAGSNAGLLDASLSVDSGEHFVVAGPSGAGKTTLLRLIAGLERPDSGSIAIGGRDVTTLAPRFRNVSLVSQRPAIYPHLDVRRNLSASIDLRRSKGWFPLSERGSVSVGERDRRVEEAAAILGLTPLLDRRADLLSGGEQQRVVLGRAWVAQSPLWLLDEPFAHLDFPLRTQLRGELHLLRERFRTTMIEVTHDPADALALGRRVAVLRAGRLEQVGLADELYARPASRTVALALGSPAINLADGVVLGADGHPAMQFGHGVTVPLPPIIGESVGSGAVVSLGIRPENLMPASSGDGVRLGEWSVVRCAATGPGWLATLEQGGRIWQAWLRDAPVGQQLPLSVRLDQVLVFAADGRRLLPTDGGRGD